ncbi:MAG: glutamine--fructose-6-phosphate aminotransferase, partial [Candidatus Aerophobetes bacterium]|nr:glutamine--fructose-6-phosphate aminotransferase [Candidatus Aerophobetes bacterium]
MCGIVGYVGDKFIDSLLIAGLERLEYRGCDSAGIATLNKGKLGMVKNAGKIQLLKEKLKESPLGGELGIGHTRWATHGEPTTENAHPHLDCKKSVAVVHNGIIENHIEIQKELTEEGHIFTTETDTEVIPHLIEKYMDGDLKTAVQKALGKLRGSYALAIISEEDPDKIVVTKKDSSLIIGIGEDENFVASDISAISNLTSNVIFLEDGEIGVIEKRKVEIFNGEGKPLKKEIRKLEWQLGKGARKN